MKQQHNQPLITQLVFGIPIVLIGLWTLSYLPTAMGKQDTIGIVACIVFTLLCIPLGSALIFLGIKERRAALARYQETYQRYPELRHHLELIQEQAHFALSDLALYCYRDTLFCLKYGFVYYQLDELTLIGVDVHRQQENANVSANHLFLLTMTPTSKGLQYLDLGRVNQNHYLQVLELIHYVRQLRPDIRYENTVEAD